MQESGSEVVYHSHILYKLVKSPLSFYYNKSILYTELGGATQLEGKREGNRIVQTEINEKNIQWVFSEITTTSFRWQRMVKRPDGTWETEAELFAVRR